VRQESSERSSRAIGLDRGPLPGKTNHFRGEGLEGFSIKERARDKRLICTVDLE
jgi:hypothetical protein